MMRSIALAGAVVAFSIGAVAVVTATPQPPSTRIDPRLLAPSVGCLDGNGIIIKMVPNPILQPPTISDQNQAGIC